MMAHIVRIRNSLSMQNVTVLLLVLFWFTGLILGIALSRLYGPYLSSLMYSAILQPISIVGLLICIYFPFLISAFAISTGRLFAIYCFCFLKALSFGFTASGISMCWGSAGWLIRSLFMFSDKCFLVVLFWFWLQNICGNRQKNLSSLGICYFLSAVISLLDYFAISPYLLGII